MSFLEKAVYQCKGLFGISAGIPGLGDGDRLDEIVPDGSKLFR